MVCGWVQWVRVGFAEGGGWGGRGREPGGGGGACPWRSSCFPKSKKTTRERRGGGLSGHPVAGSGRSASCGGRAWSVAATRSPRLLLLACPHLIVGDVSTVTSTIELTRLTQSPGRRGGRGAGGPPCGRASGRSGGRAVGRSGGRSGGRPGGLDPAEGSPFPRNQKYARNTP